MTERPKLQSNNLKIILNDSSFTPNHIDNNSYPISNQPNGVIKTCPRCNFHNDQISKFCSECGLKYIKLISK